MREKKKFKSGYSTDNYIGESVSYKNNSFKPEVEQLQDVLKYPFLAVPQQNISKEDAEYFGIRSSIDPEGDGITPSATYFPYYDQNGKLSGFKKRDWSIQKEMKGHFSVVGVVKTSSMMFGQNKISGKRKLLVICEGEGDVVAAYRAIKDSYTIWVRDQKAANPSKKIPESISPNVVGLNCGAGNALECVAHNEAFLREFEKIVLALDNDKATASEAKKGVKKGVEATEDIASFLLTDNLYTVKFAKGCKDPRDMYAQGLSTALGQALLFPKEKYSPEKIVSGSDVTLEELITPQKEGFYLQRYPKLMQMTHGFRQGELTTYIAPSGVGKSTITREVAWELVRSGFKVGFIFLEEPRIKTQQAMLCLEMGIRLPKFRENPLACATKEQIEEARVQILGQDRTFFLDHFGSLQVDKLMQQLRHLHYICGCEHIFIDHTSMVVAGLETNNERKELDMLFERLAAFVSSHAVGIHVVHHLKQTQESQSKKGKKEEEPQAYWREVNNSMIRGTAGVEQMSFTIIAIEPEILPNGKRGRIRLKVTKNREWGSMGICDTMVMKEDGRMHVVTDSEDYIHIDYNEVEDPEYVIAEAY